MEERTAHLCGRSNDIAKRGDQKMQKGEDCCGHAPKWGRDRRFWVQMGGLS